MRLPWPFGRSTEAPERPAADRPDSVPPAAHGAWASLPPIQRAIGAAPLVAPTEPFLADVPGARPLPPIVETLGHDVTSMAPVGLVAAPVHPTASLTSHAALVPSPVQRRVKAAGGAWSSPMAPEALEAPAASLAPTAPPEGPSRTLGVVPPEATVRPPARSLTQAEAADVTVRAAAAPAAPAPAAPGLAHTGTPGHRPLVSRRTQISPGAPTRAATPVAQTPSAPPMPVTVSRTTESPAAGSAPLAPAADRSHRAGLGAPLSATPPTAVSPEVAQAFPAPELARLAAAKAAGQGPDDLGPGAGQAIDGEAAGPLDLARAPRIARPTAGAAPLHTTIMRRTTEPAAPASPAQVAHGGEASVSGLNLARPGTGTPSWLPVLPVVGERRHDDGPAAAASPGTAGPIQRSTPRASQSAAIPAENAQGDRPATERPIPPLRRPLLGSRPIRTSVQTERAGEPSSGTPDASEERPAGVQGAPSIASAQAVAAGLDVMETTWSAGQPASALAGPRTSALPGRTLPAFPAVQRRDASGAGGARSAVSPGPSAGDPTSGTAPMPGIPTKGAPASWSLARGAIPAVAPAAVQRASGGAADTWSARRPIAASGGSGAGPQDWPAAVAGAAAPDDRAEMPLARVPSPVIPASSVAATAPPAATISRSIVAAAPAGPTIDRASTQAATATESPVLSVTATPVIQRIDGAAPAPAEPAAEHSETDLDELTKKIFGRLRNRLRNEYIYEREAKGLTFDNP